MVYVYGRDTKYGKKSKTKQPSPLMSPVRNRVSHLAPYKEAQLRAQSATSLLITFAHFFFLVNLLKSP